jgi:hypothetical protein
MVFGHKDLSLDTLRASQLEGRATLESDPSAKLEAEMGGWTAEPLPASPIFVVTHQTSWREGVKLSASNN